MKQFYIKTTKQSTGKVYPFINVIPYKGFITKSDVSSTGENIFLLQNFRKGPPGQIWSLGNFNIMPGLFNPFHLQEIINQSSINIYFTQS